MLLDAVLLGRCTLVALDLDEPAEARALGLEIGPPLSWAIHATPAPKAGPSLERLNADGEPLGINVLRDVLRDGFWAISQVTVRPTKPNTGPWI